LSVGNLLHDRAVPGDPLKISARVWNAILDNTRKSRRSGRGNGAIASANELRFASLEILVRNDSVGSIPQWGILKITDPLVSHTSLPLEFEDDPIFAGIQPSASADVVCVLLQPLDSGDIGVACLAGITIANVNFTDASHAYAVPTTSVTEFASAVFGPVRVLKKPAGTGNLSCVVSINPFSFRETAAVVVREADGSPTGAASTIEFDQLSGLVVSSVAGGVAAIALRPASLIESGGLTNLSQDIAGEKRLVGDDFIVADDDSGVASSTERTTVASTSVRIRDDDSGDITGDTDIVVTPNLIQRTRDASVTHKIDLTETDAAEPTLIISQCSLWPAGGIRVGVGATAGVTGTGGGGDTYVNGVATGLGSGPTIADGSITTAKLADDAVTAAKIAAGAVGASEIATGAVGTDELADEAVTAAKIASGVIPAAATTGEMSSDSSTTVFATPGRLANNVRIPKVQVTWTYASSTLTNRKSKGVSSMTRTSLGRIKITFSTSFSDTYYHVQITSSIDQNFTVTKNVGDCTVGFHNADGSANVDPAEATVQICGDW